MNWNMASESISLVVLCIIWVYSRKGTPIPSLKDRLFQIGFAVTFCAITSNMLSVVLLHNLSPELLFLAWLANEFYFLATPLMGMIYFFYVLSSVLEGAARLPRYLLLSALPGIFYGVVSLTNPWTGQLFTITLETGYQQGTWILLTYLIFYLYCLACIGVVIWKGRQIPPAVRNILLSFPAIALAVILIQMAYPTIVLTGSAATCAILIIYLYLQNKRLSIDNLTNVPNRQEFLKRLDLMVKREEPFAAAVLSLRAFKVINDAYGQHVGDAFLVAVCDFLRQAFSLREGDLYRYGGDEFAIFLRGNDEAWLMDAVYRISNRMALPWQEGDNLCFLYSAVGAVRYPETCQQREGLINGLEYAVSKAKADAVSEHICICTPELLEKAKRRQTVTDILKQALVNDEFEVYYQPIYTIEQDGFLSAEALLRMKGTDLGDLYPDEFIPVAEESGLIVDISYLVLERVCRDIRELMNRGISFTGISVNFSPVQFTQKDLLCRMEEILERFDVPWSKLKIEITESTLVENIEAVDEYIRELHARKVRIALDDFGTGYSNLMSVIDLPIDVVKLDKSLIWAAVKNARCNIVVENFAHSFRSLGLSILAEGVETEEQRQFVVDCGCNLIQGFLYARPMPWPDFLEFMEKESRRGKTARRHG